MSWAEDMQHVQDQAAGLLELVVVQPDDVRGLIALAETGDPDADRGLRMVSGALARIQGAPQPSRRSARHVRSRCATASSPS